MRDCQSFKSKSNIQEICPPNPAQSGDLCSSVSLRALTLTKPCLAAPFSRGLLEHTPGESQEILRRIPVWLINIYFPQAQPEFIPLVKIFTEDYSLLKDSFSNSTGKLL